MNKLSCVVAGPINTYYKRNYGFLHKKLSDMFRKN